MGATGHAWLLGTWNVASVTEELDFYVRILINLKLYSHLWLVATILDSAPV